MEDLLASFDAITREAISCIVGHPLTNTQWQQAKLPLSMGGLGLQAAEELAPIAYYTSYLCSHTLINDLLHPGTDNLDDARLPAPLLDALSVKMRDEVTVETLTGVTQKMATFKFTQIVIQIFGLHENESRGGILAEISNWQIYIGMATCA